MNFQDYKNYFQPLQLYHNDSLIVLEYGDQYIKITNDQYDVITAIQQHNTIDGVIAQLQQSYDDIHHDNIHDYLAIIYDNINDSIATELEDYTHFNIKIASSYWLMNIGILFQWLFIPKIFFTWFSCSLIFILYKLYVNPFVYDEMQVHITDTFLMWPVLFCIGIIHEFGHFSAASLIDRRKANIFFAFYFFTPVFYTDVTYIWKGSKLQRVITNLAGYAFQSLPTIAILIIASITNNGFLFTIGLLSAIDIIMSLIMPFGRGDMYWVLCDLFNKENLLEHVKHTVRVLIFKRKFVYHDRFTIIYGLSNLAAMIFFFSTALTLSWDHIPNLPLKILAFDFNFLYRDLIALGLYLFLIRIIVRLSVRTFRKLVLKHDFFPEAAKL